jgi:23S rRNA (cytosine1962-C5)-methyltransferase
VWAERSSTRALATRYTGPMRELRLVKDVRASIEAGHPWVYRDALERSDARPGELVRVVDRDRSTLALGFADEGVIALRIVARKKRELEAGAVDARLASAMALREAFVGEDTTAFRWVNGEADRLPGLVVDVYGGFAVVRFDSVGAERFVLEACAGRGERGLVAALRAARPSLAGVLVRKGRGDAKEVRLVWGEEPPALVRVTEHGMVMLADLRHGQKTGLFLDHRESRRRIRGLAGGRDVLNLYGYTGGFSIAAGLGGARSVETVDVAEAALALAEAGWSANGLPVGAHTRRTEDVPRFLEQAREASRQYDLVVGDPPSFAPNEAAVPNAMRSYRALHRACLRLLRPGGLYLAASCSSHIGTERFDRTIREAVEKIPRHVRILERWGGAADHPRLPAFPEGDYLKCVLLAID